MRSAVFSIPGLGCLQAAAAQLANALDDQLMGPGIKRPATHQLNVISNFSSEWRKIYTGERSPFT